MIFSGVSWAVLSLVVKAAIPSAPLAKEPAWEKRGLMRGRRLDFLVNEGLVCTFTVDSRPDQDETVLLENSRMRIIRNHAVRSRQKNVFWKDANAGVDCVGRS